MRALILPVVSGTQGKASTEKGECRGDKNVFLSSPRGELGRLL